MRLLPFSTSVTTATAVLLLLSSVSTTSLATETSIRFSKSHISTKDLPKYHPYDTLAKRAGDSHDEHDHPAPVTITTTVAIAPITGPTPTPTIPDHDHPHPQEGRLEDSHDDHAGHDHGESESDAGHSHGPARTCDDHDHDHGAYVVWHHIVAILVLMLFAGLGCVLPMMIRDSSRSRFAVQLGKYFGAGVVLSVAFIHILPEALFSLTHPCLSKSWTDDYPGYAPLIMMVSGLTMLVIEFLASSVAVSVEARNKEAAAAAAHSHDLEVQAWSVEPQEHEHDRGHDHDHDHDHKHTSPIHPLDSSETVSPSTVTSPVRKTSSHDLDGCNHAHGLTLLQCGPGVSTKVSTYMLELGIALHSVFIGIALGTLAGSEFVAMTIAICFHQFFEGIALGSRIADLTFPGRRWFPALLVAIFALVTPLGVAIGMGMHTSYKANSAESLIIKGVFDSIACGVLLYTAFVTLLGGDILYSERFRAESRASKASYLVAVWMGALSMAVIALWA
ncbi:solute carrier family 39 (zinc transporter), member 1/2/3 [Entomortierella parvispora]|uniref:Solute carrier family 39 (Zinc transporter), member 1/2/3 n=1 Tax=Entomortierella parvispora TaxID=205924 RepID=A0A9P3HLW8_9FUNG|nr:solute carrier family 39 (zinc transporter), member 1/2/3 [Entomortierella parvispora]